MTAESYKELLQQREALEQQIKEARARELGSAVAKVREIVAEFGLTHQDIFATGRTRSKTVKEGSVQPKYRDPQTGNTWTGRGREPVWIRGKDRSEFEIAS